MIGLKNFLLCMSSVSQHLAIFLHLRLFTAAFCNFVWSTVYDISCVVLDDTAVDLIALLTVLAFFTLKMIELNIVYHLCD